MRSEGRAVVRDARLRWSCSKAPQKRSYRKEPQKQSCGKEPQSRGRKSAVGRNKLRPYIVKHGPNHL